MRHFAVNDILLSLQMRNITSVFSKAEICESANKMATRGLPLDADR